MFDKNVSGKPLFVNVGRQEVIKGFDQALVGMKLGGERTVRIPSHLAYGKKGLPPAIPKNANLQFEVSSNITCKDSVAICSFYLLDQAHFFSLSI